MRLTELTSRLIPEKEEKILSILRTKCSDAYTNWTNNSNCCIWRGVSNTPANWYLADSSNAPPRKSANTLNYYTLIIDNSPRWSKFPKRSQSFVCSTSKATAGAYGTALFAVFPFNGTPIGICPRNDIWDSFMIMRQKYGGRSWFAGATASSINGEISFLIESARLLDGFEKFPKPNDDTLEDFKLALQLTGKVFKKYKIFSMGKLVTELRAVTPDVYISDYMKFATHLIDSRIIFDSDAVINEYDSLLDPVENKFELCEPKTYSKYFIPSESNEVWFSGKAVFVKHSCLDELSNAPD